ncbi:MAG: translation initiation factor 2 [Hyphomicrobiales bacterium]|nr:MAG: translation initiation factor 2 [Hyphomicrobiales bacterium]
MRILHALAATALVLGGCATVTRGTTNDVTFLSTPSGAEVRTSTGRVCTTPCTLKIDRKEEFVATFTAPDYPPVEVEVVTKVANAGAAGFAGNVLAGGVIGMGVDAATGSTLEHVPNPIHIDFTKGGALIEKTLGEPQQLAAPTS